ncbi:MAG: tetraacyldisaccharide 4'-kinase [Alphaproteobacteria bacterium]
MTLKTPSYWYPKDERRDWRRMALCPFASLYGVFFKLHQGMTRTKKAPLPILCLGNLVAGGTGKTPSAIAVLNYLKDQGLADNPGFMLRGYGGAERGPLLVNTAKHSAWDVGDESLILAQHAPTIVSADRIAGAALAAKHGIDFLVMDDGLQNPGIQKDISIIVVNGEMGFGNGKMMPAGPLREPLERGLAKADAFLLIGDDRAGVLDMLPDDVPVLRGHLKPSPDFKANLKQRYFAFAGLGYPDKFFNFLRDDLGLNVVETQAFGDHCPYGAGDFRALREKAKSMDARLITTTKDYLRLPIGDKDLVDIVPVAMEIDGLDTLDALVQGLGRS